MVDGADVLRLGRPDGPLARHRQTRPHAEHAGRVRRTPGPPRTPRPRAGNRRHRRQMAAAVRQLAARRDPLALAQGVDRRPPRPRPESPPVVAGLGHRRRPRRTVRAHRGRAPRHPRPDPPRGPRTPHREHPRHALARRPRRRRTEDRLHRRHPDGRRPAQPRRRRMGDRAPARLLGGRVRGRQGREAGRARRHPHPAPGLRRRHRHDPAQRHAAPRRPGPVRARGAADAAARGRRHGRLPRDTRRHRRLVSARPRTVACVHRDEGRTRCPRALPEHPCGPDGRAAGGHRLRCVADDVGPMART